jgi:hypothetical protein
MNNAPNVLSNEGNFKDISYRLSPKMGRQWALSQRHEDLYQTGWKLDGGVCHGCL